MFGPNTHLTTTSTIDGSHRDPPFMRAFQETRETIQRVFGLEDFDICLIHGSATVGVEAVVFSLRNPIRLVGVPGVFHERWRRMCEHYNRFKQGDTIDFYCHLETSLSQVNSFSGGIVDAVSSFPFYPIPPDAKVFVTSSNKQLGSTTGIAIVGIRHDFWPNLIDGDTFSYLNLTRYRRFAEDNQSPSTFPSHSLAHLLQVLRTFDIHRLTEKIQRNSNLIVQLFGEPAVVGERVSPVITLRKECVPQEVARDYDLYGYWSHSDYYQIFTYSCADEDYERFADHVQRRHTAIRQQDA